MKRAMIEAVTVLAATLVAGTVSGQVVEQARGVDPMVDYAALKELGPWDDRNYQLTARDLEAIPRQEIELDEPIPAFFRVEIRESFDRDLGVPFRYPHSAYPRFLTSYGGYLIDGVLYRDVRYVDGVWQVDTDKPVAPVGEDQDPARVARKALEQDVRVTSPNGAAESAIAINPADPDVVIAGSNGPGSGQKMHYSTDGGETWNQASALPFGGACCDPTVVWSSDGTLGFAATLGNGVYVYRTADGGQTWTDFENEPGSDPRREISSGFVDKEFLHMDTHEGSSCTDTLYLCWHESWVQKFSRSTDLGHTWSSPVTVLNGSTYPGIGNDITSGPSGAVYYVWPSPDTQRIRFAKSTDCGASFSSTGVIADTEASYEFRIPSMRNRKVFVYVSADSDRSGGEHHGSIYVAWTDSTAPTGFDASANHARIQVAFSRNGGDTWSVSTPHETADALTVDRWHPWLGVGPDGTVHVGYYDTRNDPTRESVDFYWAYSTDGAQTWSTPERLTSASSPRINDNFEFGDYNGLDVAMQNLITIFTDNRDESGGSSESVDVYSAGRSLGLFADGFESGGVTEWSNSVGIAP